MAAVALSLGRLVAGWHYYHAQRTSVYTKAASKYSTMRVGVCSAGPDLDHFLRLASLRRDAAEGVGRLLHSLCYHGCIRGHGDSCALSSGKWAVWRDGGGKGTARNGDRWHLRVLLAVLGDLKRDGALRRLRGLCRGSALRLADEWCGDGRLVRDIHGGSGRLRLIEEDHLRLPQCARLCAAEMRA